MTVSFLRQFMVSAKTHRTLQAVQNRPLGNPPPLSFFWTTRNSFQKKKKRLLFENCESRASPSIESSLDYCIGSIYSNSDTANTRLPFSPYQVNNKTATTKLMLHFCMVSLSFINSTAWYAVLSIPTAYQVAMGNSKRAYN